MVTFSTCFAQTLTDVHTGREITEINLRNKIEVIDFLDYVIPFNVYETYWEHSPTCILFEDCDYEFLLTFALLVIESEGY